MEGKTKGMYLCEECGGAEFRSYPSVTWNMKTHKFEMAAKPKISDLECAECDYQPEWVDLTVAPYSNKIGSRKVVLLDSNPECNFPDGWWSGDEKMVLHHAGKKLYLITKLSEKQPPPGELIFLKKVSPWQWEIDYGTEA
jgi:hypothetical protein